MVNTLLKAICVIKNFSFPKSSYKKKKEFLKGATGACCARPGDVMSAAIRQQHRGL